MTQRRGYDESLMGMEVRRVLARDPTMSERQAILETDANEGNLRRHQGKLLASRKQDGADAQAVGYPATLCEEGGVTTFSASAPHGDGRIAVTLRFAAARAAGGRPGLTSSLVTRHGDGRSQVDVDPCEALRLLGLGLVPERGALVAHAGAPPVAVILGGELHRRWKATGCRDVPGLLPEAVEREWERLRVGGLDAVSTLVDHGTRRLAACHSGRVDPATLARALGPDADRPLRSVLHAMASFACPEAAVMSTAETHEWLGRPVDMLVRVLDHSHDGTLHRPVTHADAAWLTGLLGHRDVEPVGPEATLLVRSRLRIDPSRVETDHDAAALVRLAQAAHVVARATRSDPAAIMDMVLGRLADAADRARGLGEVTARLDDEPMDGDGLLGPSLRALPSFPRSIAALSVGVERLCERVAIDLVLPTLALDDQAGPHRARPDGETVAAALRRIEAVARDMVVQGRGVPEQVAAVTGSRVTEHASDDATPFALDLATALDVTCRAQRSGEALDAAWRRHAPSLSPRWRDGGRTAVTDLLSGVGRLVGPPEPVGIAGGLRMLGLGNARGR